MLEWEELTDAERDVYSTRGLGKDDYRQAVMLINLTNEVARLGLEIIENLFACEMLRSNGRTDRANEIRLAMGQEYLKLQHMAYHIGLVAVTVDDNDD